MYRILLRQSLFLSVLCVLLVTPVFASEGKNNTLQPLKMAQRNEWPKRKHPEFASRIKSIRTIGIASPQVQAYHYVNDIPEPRNEWAEAGKRGALKGIKARFQWARSKVIDADNSTATDLEDVYALYYAIVTSIENHAKKGKNVFYDKFTSFEYSVGQISSILDRNRVDALLLTTVYGVIYSKSLQASQKGGIATAALVDRTGSLLWYGNSDVLFDLDIRKESGSEFGIEQALERFPFEDLQ